MDKYRRVAKEKNADKDIPEDEIRVSASGRTATYITYAAKLFNEKNVDKFTIKATGTALATAVTVAEIIKRRFKGLHQITKLGSIEIVDEYEPLEEGLDQVTDVRQVSFVEITLSKTGLDVKDKGYQPPISDDLVKEVSAEDMARGRGGRRGRGGGKGKSKGKGRSPKGKGRSATKGRKGKEGKKAAGKDKGGTKGSKKSRNKGKGKWGGYDSYGDGSYGYNDSYGRKAQGKGGKGKGGKDFEKGKGKGKGGKKGQGKGGKYKGWY